MLRLRPVFGLLAALRPAVLPPAVERTPRRVFCADAAPPTPGAATPEEDARWMAQALQEAELAYAKGEVPIGAVIVRDGTLVAAAHNQVEGSHDASAHAEMLCMRAAADAHVFASRRPPAHNPFLLVNNDGSLINKLSQSADG